MVKKVSVFQIVTFPCVKINGGTMELVKIQVNANVFQVGEEKIALRDIHTME
jgi:hypothetical protein